jgi:demethylmenaquinone methyltransferase/2-methoxy-6-polyprenyl-1,4-benzoquinol methylase
MSSIVLMRILESAPDRYDAGMRALSFGAVPRAHHMLAEAAVWRPGLRVLEIGCGTGAVTQLLARAGAEVDAFDQNPDMLDRARRRLEGTTDARVTLEDSTAAEMDRYGEQSFDTVAASLCLSEMSTSERDYVLRQAHRVLKNDGRFVMCDEVRPAKLWQKIVHFIVRVPLMLITWVVTGTTTRALADATGELESVGFTIRSERRSRLGTLAVIVGERS